MLAKRGFTLIELLVVIAIIGILASIIMVSLSGAKSKSRDARRQADIKSIQLALSLYYNDNGMYPKNIYCPTSGGPASCTSTAPGTGLAPTYLPVVPRDPQATGACTSSAGSDCYDYYAFASAAACNANTSPPTSYHLGADMEETGTVAMLNDVDAPATGGVFGSLAVCTGGTTFDGNAAGCSGGTAAATDDCFDMTP